MSLELREGGGLNVRPLSGLDLSPVVLSLISKPSPLTLIR